MMNFKLLIPVILSVLLLSGCKIVSDQEADMLEIRKAQLESQIKESREELETLKKSASKIRDEKGLTEYYIDISIGQIHANLDVDEMIKDSYNRTTISIPVDEDYYNSVNVGDVLCDDIRRGSLAVKGSLGQWDIYIENKYKR